MRCALPDMGVLQGMRCALPDMGVLQGTAGYEVYCRVLCLNVYIFSSPLSSTSYKSHL